MTPDADLVRRCLAGEAAAWSAVLARYSDLVYGLAHRAGLDAAAKADAFQEVSVLLWKGLPRLRAAGSLLPWIATTTRRVAWRMRKRERSRAARDARSARPETDPGAPPPLAIEALEREQAVRDALRALAERCRRLLAALYFERAGGAYEDVAERLGIPRGSIGPTRQRCLEDLRRELLASGFGGDVSDVSGVSETSATASTRAAGPSKKAGPR